MHPEKTAMGTWSHRSLNCYKNQSTNAANEAKTISQQNSFCAPKNSGTELSLNWLWPDTQSHSTITGVDKIVY